MCLNDLKAKLQLSELQSHLSNRDFRNFLVISRENKIHVFFNFVERVESRCEGIFLKEFFLKRKDSTKCQKFTYSSYSPFSDKMSNVYSPGISRHPILQVSYKVAFKYILKNIYRNEWNEILGCEKYTNVSFPERKRMLLSSSSLIEKIQESKVLTSCSYFCPKVLYL